MRTEMDALRKEREEAAQAAQESQLARDLFLRYLAQWLNEGLSYEDAASRAKYAAKAFYQTGLPE